ncbi:MAG: ribonuclease HI family protein [Planctomycetota bacterium]|jgi:ribonuclease HI
MGEPHLTVTIHIDGGSRGNPGPAGAGVVIRSADDGTSLFEGGYYLGRTTNNVAEYQGLIRALERAAALKADEARVHSDSELLIRQMTGEYRVRNAGLKPLFEQARQLCRRFRRVTFSHVRREENTEADRLANQAMNLSADVEDAAE